MVTRSSILCLALLAGCHSDQNTLAPAGPGARSIAELGTTALILFSITTVVVWALLLFVAVRRRGSLDWHEPADAGGGERWIWIGGFLIPAITFGFLFAFTLERIDDFPLHEEARHAPEIRVVGHQWWWELRYFGEAPNEQVTTANELHLPVGQPVTIELQSVDVIHSFWVPQLHGKVDLIPGRTNWIRIQADAPGSYEGECAEFCGAQHAHMRLLVVAQPREEYAAWIAAQSAAARIPRDELAQRGQTLFETHACGLCHTVRGTDARGNVGPDLTHLASRQRIGANSLANNQAHLAAWSVSAQSLKPAVIMPNLNVFTGPELQAVTRFLQGLK